MAEPENASHEPAFDFLRVNERPGQIVQLECLRSVIRGTKSLWGRILTYKG